MPQDAMRDGSGVIATNFNRLALQFSERVNTNTFTVDDVTVITPGGPLRSASLTLQPVAPFDNSAFDLLLPPHPTAWFPALLRELPADDVARLHDVPLVLEHLVTPPQPPTTNHERTNP